MPKLEWIKDENLYSEVTKLLNTAKIAQINSTKKFCKNVIDPFSAIFEMSGFTLDYDSWEKSETNRQAQKTLNTQIGNFHQNILGYTSKWENRGVGNVIDLVSQERRIIAEIKNKYNTISGGKLSDVYNLLDNQISPKNSNYKGYTAYFVTIIPKKPTRINIPFTPSDNKKGEKCPSNENIREIDGASFYSLVTGYENALENLFDILPEVIYECSGGSYLFKDKEKLKSFYKLAFQ